MNVRADALVHPTNASFYMGGEVGMFTTHFHAEKLKKNCWCLIDQYAFTCVSHIGSAIAKAGGKAFQQEVKALSEEHGALDTAAGRYV